MPQTYLFSLLQYRHSVVHEEVLNAGLLVFFLEAPQLCFLHSKSLLRLQAAYPQVAATIIGEYLAHFKAQAEALNTQPGVLATIKPEGTDFSRFINECLLPADASSLRFAPPRKGLCYTTIESFLEALYRQFLGQFEAAQ